MKPEKIVFFDIDGVLLPGRAFAMPENKDLLNDKLSNMERMKMARFQPEAMKCLSQLCEKTNAKLVLMSSWGQAWWDRPMDLRDKFLAQGLNLAHFHEAWCPFGPNYEFRKHPKVLEWLAAHRTDSFVIIDDEPNLYQDDGLADVKTAIVATDPKIGLDVERTRAALKVLSYSGQTSC